MITRSEADAIEHEDHGGVSFVTLICGSCEFEWSVPARWGEPIRDDHECPRCIVIR